MKKRRQKQVARNGPTVKRAKTDKGEVRPVGSKAEQRDEPVVTGSPTVEELDQKVNDLIARPFVSEALQEVEIEEDPSDKFVISMGTDGGVSQILKETAEAEENEEADGQDEDEGETSEGDVGESPSARRIHLGVLRKRRLRRPNRKMMRRSPILRDDAEDMESVGEIGVHPSQIVPPME
ncbi:hypothetical protein Dimus_003253 [Dionaea muscipula]